MPKYEFLSPAWIDEARSIRKSTAIDASSPPLVIRMNLSVTDAPFDQSEVHAYIDTTAGFFDMEIGSLEHPEITVVLDYATAKALFVDLNPQAGMEAFMTGRIRVTGDLSKLLALQGAIAPSDSATNVALEIREMTL